MKNKLFLLFFLASLQACAQKESFDIVSYTVPKNWAKSKNESSLTFSKEKGGQFCMLTIYKSIEATEDAQQNFDLAWQSLVQENLGITALATIQQGSNDKGWETKTGSVAFEKEGVSGTAILISSTHQTKLINILCLTNTPVFQKEMEKFLQSVTLKKTTTTVAKPLETNIAEQSNSKEKAEIWWYIRYIPNDFYDATKGTRVITDYYVVYPNGDYYPDMPLTGLNNFSKATHNNDSWGKFTMANGKGSFKNKYDEIKIEKVSANELKRVGYTHSFHKCVPVDGLKLEGTWGPYPNWSKEAHYSEPGCKRLISFKKDGTFTDRGAFVSNTNNPNEHPDRAPGNGTYSISNYTLTLNYADGRTIHKAFVGGTKDPAKDDEVIYIATTPLNKK